MRPPSDVNFNVIKYHIKFKKKRLTKPNKNAYKKVSKVGDLSRGRPEGSLFNNYYTVV